MASRIGSGSFSSPQLLSLSVGKMGALEHLEAWRNRDAFLDEVACRKLDAYLSGSITYAS